MSSNAQGEQQGMYQLLSEDTDDAHSNVADSSEESSSSSINTAVTSSGEGDDKHVVEVKSVRVLVDRLLKRILQEIADGTMDLTQNDRLEDFRSGELHDLAAHTGDKSLPTALHILLDERLDLPTISNDQMKPLVTCLVRHPNDLLAKGDRNGKTPLYQAIDLRKEKMVQWMCEAHPSINTILSRESNKQHYLHFAIKRKLKYFEHMVKMADAKTLALQDAKGNTLLHLAVEYKRCRQHQLYIVRDIVARGGEEAQCDFNGDGNSPYLHHRKTVEAAAKGAVKKDDRDRADFATNVPVQNGGERQHSPQEVAGLDLPLVSGKQQSAVARPRPVVPSNSRANYNGPAPVLPGSIEEVVDGDGSALKTSVPSELSALGATNVEKKKSGRKKKSEIDEEVVQSVDRFLKLHYLRSRSYGACMDILYGKDTVPDRELFFDLSGQTQSSITLTGLRALLQQLRFEDALQYVAIPNIKIEAPTEGPSTKRTRKSRLLDQGSGRRDVVRVFDGLREKGVKTILKVVVDDSLDPPHTDEAIEESLRNMDVEVLDWKKTDLCTEVIYNAAPHLRDVHLYWGGNNAVLRGWSDEGGLKKLTELQTVRLHVQRGIESNSRTGRYVKEFGDRIKNLGFKHDVRLIIDNSPAIDWRSVNGAPARHIETKHDWIDCMKKFRGFLLNTERLNEYRGMSQDIEEPIRIALIDDGVDGAGVGFPLLGGRTFCSRDEENRLNHPYYASAAGNGTAMARLINFICPLAQLYVLRVPEAQLSEGFGVRQIPARSAAQAIAAAVRKGVHIISMSWTIEPPEDDVVRRELETAILDADRANILMFCSASDQGARQTDTYPSRATRRILTIGAAGPSGETSPCVGNPDKVDFTFPGDSVELMDGEAAAGPAKVVSGSSAATALAAGLAALVLYCVQVRLWHVPEAEKEQVRRDFEALKKHEEMVKAFRYSIGTSPGSGYKFVTVWDVFEAALEERNRYDDPDQLVQLVARIGGKLCMRTP